VYKKKGIEELKDIPYILSCTAILELLADDGGVLLKDRIRFR
jgi:hypothetical protein